MEPVTFRAVERIIAVVIGGLCVYLGYRLFLHIPHHKDSQGKIDLPGGISIFVTRVGPGVFFALFGAIVVALSIYHNILYFREGRGSSGIEYYSGLTPRHSMHDKEETDRRRRELRLEVEFLNTLPLMLKSERSHEQRRDFKYHSASIKLALMKTVWESDWGDLDAFRVWVESGALDPVPKGLEAPAAYYRTGQEMVE